MLKYLLAIGCDDARVERCRSLGNAPALKQGTEFLIFRCVRVESVRLIIQVVVPVVNRKWLSVFVVLHFNTSSTGASVLLLKYGASCRFKLWRARWSLPLTVPTSAPTTTAISPSVNSSYSKRTKASRWSGDKSSIARSTACDNSASSS